MNSRATPARAPAPCATTRNRGKSVIPEIVPCADDESVVVAGTCPELLDGLAGERARITAAIDDLIAARDIVDSLVGHPLQSVPEGCTAVPVPAAEPVFAWAVDRSRSTLPPGFGD